MNTATFPVSDAPVFNATTRTLITCHRHVLKIIEDGMHWVYRYKDIPVHIEKRGQEYFARPVNDDGETVAPVAIGGTLDLTIEKVEDGIDWINGEASVIFGHLTIRTRKVGDLYTSYVEGFSDFAFPEATAPTVQYSKVLAASKWEMTLHGYTC